MNEREGIIIDYGAAESGSLAEMDGDVVHPDDLDPNLQHPKKSPDELYESAVAVAEMMEDEYTVETFGTAYPEVRATLQAAVDTAEVKNRKDVIVFLGEGRDRVSAAHYIATDVFNMFKQGTITKQGYESLLEEFEDTTTVVKKTAPLYESGQAKYKDWQGAAANDREE